MEIYDYFDYHENIHFGGETFGLLAIFNTKSIMQIIWLNMFFIKRKMS